MDTPQPFCFPPGATLESGLADAMKRMESLGIRYPDGYYDRLVAKYRDQAIRYPFALLLAGTPRLQGHFSFPRVLNQTGKFLDYGCGCGDSVRTLIRNGFSRDRITAFDVSWSGIDLGFDLYCDRGESSGNFVVSGSFPFGPEEFSTVYSGHVLHCLGDEDEFTQYLKNAFVTLRPGGFIFGTTMGNLEDVGTFPTESGMARVMTREQLAGYLAAAGFTDAVFVVRPLMQGTIAALVRAGCATRVSRGILRYLFARFPGCNNYNRHMLVFSAEKPGPS